MLKLLKKVLLFCLITFCFLNTQCEDDEIIIDVDSTCDYITVINQSEYTNASSDGLTFISAKIEGDCLMIGVGASGCDGSTWELKLIDSGAVAESFPEQRYLKLDFNNNEACLAHFEKNFSFDLKPVRVPGSSKIILHINGIEGALEYSY